MEVFDLYDEKDYDTALFKLYGCDLDYNVNEKWEILNETLNSLQRKSKYDFKGGRKTLDFKLDYKFIWSSFMQVYQIDINKTKLNWWEFDSLLDAILLQGLGAITKVIEYRTYKRPKKNHDYSKDHHNFMTKMKYKYELPDMPPEVHGALGNYLEKKAKEGEMNA